MNTVTYTLTLSEGNAILHALQVQRIRAAESEAYAGELVELDALVDKIWKAGEEENAAA